MPTDLTPETARASLASAKLARTRGVRRGVWPWWAHVSEAIVGATTITAIGIAGFALPEMLWALGVGIIGVALRYAFVFMFGVFPKLGWLDGAMILLVLLAIWSALFLPGMTGLPWLVWLPGPAFSFLNLGREWLRRRIGWVYLPERNE